MEVAVIAKGAKLLNDSQLRRRNGNSS